MATAKNLYLRNKAKEKLAAGQVVVGSGTGTDPAGGVGRAVVTTLAREGAKVAIVDMPGSAAGDVAKQVCAEGGTAAALEADVTDMKQVDHMAGAVRSQLGPVRVLINNAGTQRAIGPVWDVDPRFAAQRSAGQSLRLFPVLPRGRA